MSDLPIPHHFWVETASGGAFDLMNPRPEQCRIEDVATALSKQCRFNGQLPGNTFYSVAQHCCLVAALVPAEEGKRALLHDVEEAWYGDMVAPWKRLLAFHTTIVKFYVDRARQAAAAAFGVPFPIATPAIQRADMLALAAERRDLLWSVRPGPQEWGELPDPASVPTILPWEPAVARARFLELYDMFGGAS